jgi:uncharacterized protein involved in exopolysaccharide biosynthesis
MPPMHAEGVTDRALPSFVTDPIGLLRRRWPWIVSVSLTGLVATVIAVSLMRPTYVAVATVMISDQLIPEAFVPDTTGDRTLDRVGALVGEVFSRTRLAPVIERHDLYADIREAKPGTDLVEVVRYNASILPATPAGISSGQRAAATLYAISFRHESPEVAAEIANELATLFTAAASRGRGQRAQLTADFMRAELERSERELRDQERLVTEFKERYRGELPGELDTSTSRLERLAIQNQTLVAQLEAAESRLKDLEQLGDLTSPTSPYARLSALRAKLVDELAINTEEHPNVLALKRQIEALERELTRTDQSSDDPTANLAVRAARKEVADLRDQRQRVASEMGSLEARVAQTPKREEELAALSQRLSVLQETYVTNLRKLEAAELSRSVESAQQGARAEVLDRARPPLTPERSHLKWLLAGLVGALGAGVAAGLLVEALDPVVVSAEQIQTELGLAVLGSVSRIE